MSRFYVPKNNIVKNIAKVDGNEAHHAMKVMRIRENDPVTIFDGSGCEYKGFVKNMGRASFIVEIAEKKIPTLEKFPQVTLIQAIPKKQKMSTIIEKATELGVYQVIPIITERVISKVEASKRELKIKRWNKVALEASKQCGRADVPNITPISEFYDVLAHIDDYDLAIMACLNDRTKPLKNVLKNFLTGRIAVFIGPEGDFTRNEIRDAEDRNIKLVSLGRRVLKSDTAGLYLLSALHYEFGF